MIKNNKYVSAIIRRIYGPILMMFAFRTLFRIWNAMKPEGCGIPDKHFFAFSSVDAGFWVWYRKISMDYSRFGRFGYCWDDGLGMPLGVRAYNNYVTYFFLNLLHQRRYLAIGFISFAGVLGCISSIEYGPLFAVLFTLTLIASPFVVSVFMHYGKPEVFWYGAAMLCLYYTFSGHFVVAGIIWSMIAFVNLGCSIMIVMFFGPIAIVNAIAHNSVLGLFLSCLPGLLKHGFRIAMMLKNGFLNNLVSEQSRLWKRPWYPTAIDLAWWIPYLFSIIATTFQGKLPFENLFLLGLWPIFVYWSNNRILYFNDQQNVNMTLLIAAIAIAGAHFSPIGIIFILVFAYNHPGLCGIPLTQKILKKVHVKLSDPNILLRVSNFPSLDPMTFPMPEELKCLFLRMTANSRIIAESDGDPRTISKFRGFWLWVDGFLPERNIDLVNDLYFRLNEPDLFNRYLIPFSSDHMSGDKMLDICKSLGAGYVVAHSDRTVQSLIENGFLICAVADIAPLEDFRRLVSAPPVILTLLKNPDRAGVIDPDVQWNYNKKGAMRWNATRTGEYKIRIRYHKYMKATNNGMPIRVKPYQPFQNVPTQFMKITIENPGQVDLFYCQKII